MGKFPALDGLHTHCQLETTFEQPCLQLFQNMEDKVLRGFKDPAQGRYNLFDSGGNRIWLQRETPTGKYFDDVEFTFA